MASNGPGGEVVQVHEIATRPDGVSLVACCTGGLGTRPTHDNDDCNTQQADPVPCLGRDP
jgi:hypothetical protein